LFESSKLQRIGAAILAGLFCGEIGWRGKNKLIVGEKVRKGC
jgi:hypothetical protein